MSINIKPVLDRVLIQHIETPSDIISGAGTVNLVLAKVIGVGPAVTQGKIFEEFRTELKEGDTVIVLSTAGHKYPYEGKTYRFICAGEIFGVVP